MHCPNCHTLVPAKQGPCPNCGFVLTQPIASRSFGSRRPGLLITLSLSLCLFIVFCGTVAFREVVLPAPARGKQLRQQPTKKEYVVEHGKVVDPADLHGTGTLYLVPVGRQAIPVSYFVDYYHKKFGIDITMLDQVQLPASACVPKRHQCIGEEVMVAMTNAYPEIAKNPESVMIALTDEDIFPIEFDWNFTYSLHQSRIGVVSTRRMDPAFWGDQENAAVRLASTKQMLTKYIAMEYFHLPESFDQSSILATPLTPDGGSDDLYESDLHPEDSANGRMGKIMPCLFLTYSYTAHEVKMESPLLRDCLDRKVATSRDEEVFETQLDWGNFVQRSMDIKLGSTPPILFKRAYNSGITNPAAFGWGANHSYNAGLTSDGLGALTYLHIEHEDGSYDLYDRTPAGRGFEANAIYENHDFAEYGARLRYELPHYKLQYRNGAQSMFFASVTAGPHSYWYNYQDSKGNTLSSDRGPQQELRQLAASDGQSVDFQSDDHLRIVQAVASDGTGLAYDYDEDGCLARVSRSDGTMI